MNILNILYIRIQFRINVHILSSRKYGKLTSHRIINRRTTNRENLTINHLRKSLYTNFSEMEEPHMGHVVLTNILLYVFHASNLNLRTLIMLLFQPIKFFPRLVLLYKYNWNQDFPSKTSDLTVEFSVHGESRRFRAVSVPRARLC